MKKLVFMVSAAALAFGVVACGEETGDPKCDSSCNGRLTTNQCQLYDSSLYLSGSISCNTATCAIDDSGCTRVPSNSRNEFETCTPGTTAQGDCNAGLECTSDGTTNICFTPCDPANDQCGANRGCVELTGGGGICFGTTATRDTECLDNFQLCATGAGECSPRDSDDNGLGTTFRCTLTCPAAELDTQGSCPATETCLSSGWIQPQETQPTPACTAGQVGTQGPCDAGYTCETTSTGTTGCYAPIGWCGTIAPLLDMGFDGYQAAAGSCDDIDGHALCGIQNAVNPPAYAFCEDFGLGGACVTICEDFDNPAITLDCGDNGTGTAWNCRLPTESEQIYFNVQYNGNVPVECTNPQPTGGTDAACDPAGQFLCYALSSGDLCSRPYKMCFSN